MNKHYTFLKAKNADVVPAILSQDAEAKPLHSMVDPVREAQRLAQTITNGTGFVILLGLGGGFASQAILEKTQAQVVVIDYNSEGIKELLSSKDYSSLLNNERFSLLVDMSFVDIKKYILDNYIPAICGDIQLIPLRTRTEEDRQKFEDASAAIQEALEYIRADYSVQSHFGLRWFSNIIRNVKFAKNMAEFYPQNREMGDAAIVAAGPSLDFQIPLLQKEKEHRTFIIASDTSIPVLLHNGIEPDAVLSIDCQHISYYHFTGCSLKSQKGFIPLILDIASPPLLSSFSPSHYFFCSGHPLARYISENYFTMPPLDTSGGNVTYACLSFAEYIGAKNIKLYGADFSYVKSQSYARGTYIYPFFEKKQNRFSPLEALFSSFLYRSPFLAPQAENQKYHETSSLRMYRKRLEEKALSMNAKISAAQGCGAPIDFTGRKQAGLSSAPAAQKSKNNIENFLEQYRKDILFLPLINPLSKECSAKDREIFATLLPCAAALKHRNKNLSGAELLEELKTYCIKEIDKVNLP